MQLVAIAAAQWFLYYENREQFNDGQKEVQFSQQALGKQVTLRLKPEFGMGKLADIRP